MEAVYFRPRWESAHTPAALNRSDSSTDYMVNPNNETDSKGTFADLQSFLVRVLPLSLVLVRFRHISSAHSLCAFANSVH